MSAEILKFPKQVTLPVTYIPDVMTCGHCQRQLWFMRNDNLIECAECNSLYAMDGKRVSIQRDPGDENDREWSE